MARPSNNGGRSPHCAVARGGNEVKRGVSGQDHERKQLFGMGVRGGGWLRPALAMLLVMSCAVGETAALDIAYCSNFNTGSNSAPSTPSLLSKRHSGLVGNHTAEYLLTFGVVFSGEYISEQWFVPGVLCGRLCFCHSSRPKMLVFEC